MDSGAVCQVAWVSLFSRDRDDLTPVFENGSRSGGRDRRAPDEARVFDVTGAQLEKVSRDTDGQLFAPRLFNIKKVKMSGLFIDDPSASCRGFDHRKVHVKSELFDFF
jgi:hypothetical protein